MKKLIVVAAIVCAAVCSQAAQFSWSGWGTHENEDWYTGGLAYLVQLNAGETALNVAVEGGQLVVKNGTVLDSVAIAGGMAAGNKDMGDYGISAGDTATFAMIFTDATGTEGSTTLPSSGLYGINDNDGDYYTVTFDKDSGGTFYNENTWAVVNTQVAPEPTSGLLLLIGMAGLALRRRRA